MSEAKIGIFKLSLWKLKGKSVIWVSQRNSDHLQ